MGFTHSKDAAVIVDGKEIGTISPGEFIGSLYTKPEVSWAYDDPSDSDPVPEQLVIWTMERGDGKTTKIIRWILEDPDNRCVVVTNAREEARYLNLLMFEGLPRGRAAPCVRIYKGGLVGSDHLAREYAIDDIERFLAILLGSAPSLITTSADLGWA